ncbi:sigma-70 family RNA polymerase sigma factor [Pseudothermotoga thermarum]|uniref:RNA polymerase, sigma 28 subunit, SigD/FliA/WhiG n=1 Tax=Pseudothermotoga thermarum DSM 5069 TaxID=688269 RepID=F7YXZ2_9THEM|nr:FliA/WhiG family RNA polymerase sigma factor [Pseudothermotoga thermarum]AEH50791.1 RNA polymerase, sigma 28 subunit, SigD/FliA/WhiG [Pseudothermotoga thermarum DSM 5069]
MFKQDEEKIIKEMLPMVKMIALDLKNNLPKNVELDDLIQEGVLALIAAIRRYDPKKGVNIHRYAIKRVKGAMYDYLRKIDWMPRNLRRNIKEVEKAIYELEPSLGRFPTIEEISMYTGLTTAEVKRALDEMVRKQFLMLDQYLYDEETFLDQLKDDDEPFKQAQREILLEDLTQAISRLDPKEQLVLSLRFEQDLSLKEIGLIIGASESRVSQIISSALIKIKNFLMGGEHDNSGGSSGSDSEGK